MEMGSISGTNPFSQFAVGYGTSPGSFTAFGSPLHTNNFNGNANLQGYFVSNPQVVPAAVVNIASTAQEVAPGSGITALDPGQIFLHPGSLNLAAAHVGTINNAIVRFTAPTAGIYSIAGDWETLHFGTTSKQILVNGASVFSDSASAPSFNFTANLNVNDHVDFLVDPAGAISGDSVGLRARLSTDVVVAPPTCTPPQVLQNGVCVTPQPPVCIAPQVLQGNSCVTPPPTCMSPQILQGGVCVTPRPPPSVATLARMSDAVYNRQHLIGAPAIGSYQQVACHGRSGSVMSGDCQTQTGDAFKASVYKDGDQIVIAVRGTDPPANDRYNPFVKNMLANLSLWGDGSANEQVGRYVESLAKILHDVQDANQTAKITLTGHSLGGALAQVVGDSANIRSITFDAPGIKDVLTKAQLHVLRDTLANVAYRSASDTREIVNYRLQEDQVSLVGKGSLIEKNRQFGDVYTVWNPHAGLNRDSQGKYIQNFDFLQNHSMTELVSLLRDNCRPAITAPSVCLVRGYGADEGLVLRSLTAVARIACPSLPRARLFGFIGVAVNRICEGVEIAAKHSDVLLIDPAPGDQYFVGIGANSPEIAFLGLPRLIGVDGWALRYHDQGTWSDFVFKLGYGQFDFADNVEAVEFFPTDIAGNRIFNPYWFSYDIRFENDGAVSLFQISAGEVGEPSTVFLFGASLLAFMATSRMRRKRRSEPNSG